MKNQNRFLQKKAGAFTLVEIMIVIAVIGILTSIASVYFSKIKKNVYEKSCNENMKTIYGAAQFYWLEVGALPGTHQQLTCRLLADEKYLKKIPRCPYAGKNDPTSKIFYTITGENDDLVQVRCTNLLVPKLAHGMYKHGD